MAQMERNPNSRSGQNPSNKRPASSSGQRRNPRPDGKSSSSRPSGKSGASRPSGKSRSGQSSARASQASRAKRPSSSARTAQSKNSRAAQRRRREAAQKKQKLRLAAAAAILLVIIALVVIIVVSSVTVPPASSLSVESSASTQLLTWKGKPKNISYDIYRKTADSENDYTLIGTVPEGAEHSFSSTGLSSNTVYEYKIIATRGSGEDLKESKPRTIQASTLPETVTDLSAVTLSKESLTLSWSEVPRVSGYEIKFSESENLEETEPLVISAGEVVKNETNGQDTLTIPDLPVGKTYYFSIRGFSGEDVFAEWSKTNSAVVTQAVDMTGIDIHKPMVALTFDDGPDNGKVTYRILDALKAVGGHATFFQLGQLCESYPEVAKRIVDEGHEIACHTYDHAHSGDSVTPEDITRANDAIEQTSGYRPTAFRAPGGSLTDLIRETCRSQGQAIYHWSIDTLDWSSRDADSVMAEIQQNTEEGAIILMHNLYDSTAEAVERAVPWLVEQGYQLVTVDQLIQAKTGQPPVPGTQYFTAMMTN